MNSQIQIIQIMKKWEKITPPPPNDSKPLEEFAQNKTQGE
jgi:hypothetical protein